MAPIFFNKRVSQGTSTHFVEFCLGLIQRSSRVGEVNKLTRSAIAGELALGNCKAQLEMSVFRWLVPIAHDGSPYRV